MMRKRRAVGPLLLATSMAIVGGELLTVGCGSAHEIECTTSGDGCVCDFGQGDPNNLAVCDQTYKGGQVCCADPGYPGDYPSNECRCNPPSVAPSCASGKVTVSSCSNPQATGSGGSGGNGGNRCSEGPGTCTNPISANNCRCGTSCDKPCNTCDYRCEFYCNSDADCAGLYASGGVTPLKCSQPTTVATYKACYPP